MRKLSATILLTTEKKEIGPCMKKALIIAYRFPPQGGGGVQRTLKFVRYLSRFGWQPVVHTVSNPFWHLQDESLLEDIPEDVRVYRTRTFEFERLERRLGSAMGRKVKTDASASTPKKKVAPGKTTAVRQFIHKRVLVPDPQIAWLPGAFLKSLAIAYREGVDLIYTSSPPNSVQVLGLLLKRVLKKLGWRTCATLGLRGSDGSSRMWIIRVANAWKNLGNAQSPSRLTIL